MTLAEVGPSTLATALVDLVENEPHLVTTIFHDREHPHRITRRQLGDLAASYAAGFDKIGVGRGDRIVISWPPGPDFLGAFWGCQLLGAAAVPAPPPPRGRSRGEIERLGSILRRSEPAAVSMPATAADMLPEELRDLAPRAVPLADERWAGPVARPSGDDVAVVQFTSGSTWEPRGCVLSHAAVTRNVAQTSLRLGLDHRQYGVNWCPLSHDMGLMGSVVSPVWSGLLVAVQMAPEAFIRSPVTWLRVMAEYRAKVSAVPNFALALMAKRMQRTQLDLDLSCVKAVYCGAEPLHPGSLRAFLERVEPLGFSPAAIQPAYGLAEHVVMATSRPGGLHTDLLRRDGVEGGMAIPAPGAGIAAVEVASVGWPVEGASLRIVDGAGVEQPERVIGEVELTSGSVMTGYYADEAATAEVLRDGWLRTGDLGYLVDGELFLTGRAKDVVFCAGRNIFAYDVEQVVNELPGVRIGGAAVFGVDEEDSGDRLVIVVEARRSERGGLVPQVNAACVDRLGVKPRDVVVVRPGSLPRTVSGKIQRRLARAHYLSDALDQGDDA